MTEAIPKRLFDQANLLRKTLYQRSVQVPKIGTKQVFLAINPTPGGVKPYSSVSSGAQTKAGNHQQVKYINRGFEKIRYLFILFSKPQAPNRLPPASLRVTRFPSSCGPAPGVTRCCSMSPVMSPPRSRSGPPSPSRPALTKSTP